MKRRRGIIAASMAGMAAMTAVSLLQTGLIKHLPDPPLKDFDSDRVNSSDTAYAFGAPDGPISLTSFAVNIPVAAWGSEDRWRNQPCIPVAAAGKALVEAAAAGWYAYQMPAREKAWCGYCITAALASFTVAALSFPEARAAWRELRKK
jgi:uncharacterized membrane protein